MRTHVSREMRCLLREMWMWVRGMRISKGDDTSPVGNDRISQFRDMWHYSVLWEKKHVFYFVLGWHRKFSFVKLVHTIHMIIVWIYGHLV
jgi:hypothetical protein